MFLWPFFILCFIKCSWGCGISTHTEIGYRAIEYLGFSEEASSQFIRNILQSHQDAFQAGNPFPDSFYNSLCYGGLYHQKSEDTHWGHYVKVAFDFINRKYPLPWSPDTERLVAFLFGIISHQVSDINWHSLEGLQDGYLSALADLAFHGNFQTAHSYGDVADDMIGVFEWNTSTYAYEWFVPTLDLVEIYEDYYGEDENVLTEDIINECAGMLLIGRLGEHIIGKSLYYNYVKKSPIMLDMFRDYYLGGLDDMSTWTNIVWRQAAKAVLNGTNNCDIPHNTLELSCENQEHEVDMDWVVEMMSENLHSNPAEKISEAGIIDLLPSFGDLEVVHEGRGVRIRIPQDKLNQAVNGAGEFYPEAKTRDETVKMDPSDLDPSITLTTKRAYSVLGRGVQITDIDADGNLDLVVSAPGLRGCVFIVLDYNSNLFENYTNIIEEVASVEVCSESEYARFGSSFVVMDANGDGIDDLIIGEPYTGAENLEYHGGVSIYLGDVTTGQYSLSPSTKLTCTEHPCGLGSVLYEDKGDLFLGAPNAGVRGTQRGAVLKIGKSQMKKLEQSEYLVPDDLGWSLTGSQDFEHFGGSISRSSEGQTAIGSPTFRLASGASNEYSEEDIQVAGRVTIFSEAGARMQEVTGEAAFNSLGSSIKYLNLKVDAVTREVLAVGQMSSNSLSGNQEQTGSVLLFDDKLTKLASLSGNLEIGRFGMSINGFSGDFNDNIIISAPYAGLGLENYGKLYIFGEERNGAGQISFPSDGSDLTSECVSDAPPCISEWADIMLTTGEPESLFGSAVASFYEYPWIYTNPEKIYLAVAAERSSLGSRLGGSVHIFEFE